MKRYALWISDKNGDLRKKKVFAVDPDDACHKAKQLGYVCIPAGESVVICSDHKIYLEDDEP